MASTAVSVVAYAEIKMTTVSGLLFLEACSTSRPEISPSFMSQSIRSYRSFSSNAIALRPFSAQVTVYPSRVSINSSTSRMLSSSSTTMICGVFSGILSFPAGPVPDSQSSQVAFIPFGMVWKMNVQHRTSNVEHRIMMSLRSAI